RLHVLVHDRVHQDRWRQSVAYARRRLRAARLPLAVSPRGSRQAAKDAKRTGNGPSRVPITGARVRGPSIRDLETQPVDLASTPSHGRRRREQRIPAQLSIIARSPPWAPCVAWSCLEKRLGALRAFWRRGQSPARRGWRWACAAVRGPRSRTLRWVF